MKFSSDKLFYVNEEKNSKKFWEIEIDAFNKSAVVVTRRWGRIGTAGQEKAETFDSYNDARTLYYGLLDSKLRKGYRYAVGQ